MLVKKIRQKWSTRTLNSSNKVVYTKNTNELVEQLHVLKSVNKELKLPYDRMRQFDEFSDDNLGIY